MSKKKFAIITDSTTAFPDDLLEKYAINVVPLTVNWNGKSYLDNVDITPDEFYRRIVTEKEMPTTSQPSAGVFKEVYDKLAEEAEGILVILISSELSGTVASATTAAEMMGDFPVRVIDSRMTTMALGLCVLQAVEMAEAGASLDEAVESLQPLIDDMKVFFVVDTLEFLHRGGRIGGAQRLIGSVLAVKPLLQLKGGKIDSFESIRTKKKAVHRMISVFEEDAVGQDRIHISVFHGAAEEEAEEIRKYLEENYHPDTLVVANLSPVIGVHTGPGTVGISYYFE
ncbi:DegV family protein [bacterium]|nr:DegV family protein [bacterium]